MRFQPILQAALAALLTLLLGCAQRTQVIVVVDADEVIRGTPADHVHIYVRGDAAGSIGSGTPYRRDVTRPATYPFRIVLTPSGENAFGYQDRNYEVIVAAHTEDDGSLQPEQSVLGASIITARVRSGYVRGETRVLELMLDSSCRPGNAPVCAEDRTCGGGMCVPLFREPGSLLPLSVLSDAGPADAYLPPGTDAPGLDAWAPDAGVDAWSAFDAWAPDAGMDAFSPPDAFIPTDAPPLGGPLTRIGRLPSPPMDSSENFGASVATSDGSAIVVGAPGTTGRFGDFLYNFPSPGTSSPLTAEGCGQSAVINAAGTIAAFGCPASNSFIVWPSLTAAGAPMSYGTTGVGYTLATNAAGTRFAVGTSNAIFIYQDPNSVINRMFSISTVQTPLALSLSDDGSRLVAGFAGEVRTYAVTDTSITEVGTVEERLTNDLGLFGASLALSGDGTTLVVGANLASFPGMGTPGAALVYTRGGREWMPVGSLRGEITNGLFGTAVAINRDGTRFAVSALSAGSGCIGVCSGPCLTLATTRECQLRPGQGGVYVYRYDGLRVTLESYIRPPIETGTGAFGFDLSLNRAGTRLVVGDSTYDTSGAVFVVE